MDPAFKKALKISASLHVLFAILLFVKFNFFDKTEVVVMPLYSASNAPLQASMIENPKLKEADKATKARPKPVEKPPVKEPPKEEPPKEEPPKEDPVIKQQELKKQQLEKELQVKKKLEADNKKKELAENALKLKKEQEKLKKEQDKKLAEEKAKAEKLKKEQLAKQKKADELKKKQAEAKKRQQELEKAAEQQMLEDELADEADEARRAARQGQMLTERQRHIAMIVERVRQSWFTDDTMNGKQCIITLRLASNGFVTNLSVEGGDAGVCNAAVNAINRVGRFPMPEDPQLNAEFRELRLPFKK